MRTHVTNGARVVGQIVCFQVQCMLADAQGPWKAMPTTLQLYVEDVDAVYARAIAAGGTSLSEPTDQFYGDRRGGVQDICGNSWWVATHIEDVSMDEMQRRQEAAAGGH